MVNFLNSIPRTGNVYIDGMLLLAGIMLIGWRIYCFGAAGRATASEAMERLLPPRRAQFPQDMQAVQPHAPEVQEPTAEKPL